MIGRVRRARIRPRTAQERNIESTARSTINTTSHIDSMYNESSRRRKSNNGRTASNENTYKNEECEALPRE